MRNTLALLSSLAFFACQTRGEEIKERVDKALAGVSSDEQAIAAASRALWSDGTYRHDIKVSPREAGYAVELVATRTSSSTVFSNPSWFRSFELREHAKKIWRLFRTVSERKPRSIVVTVRIPLGGAGDQGILEFLRIRADDQLVRAIPGYANSDPFDTKGAYDDLQPDGDLILQRLEASLIIEVDNSRQIVIEQTEQK